MDVVEIRPDPETFRRVAAALDDEADGREWRRDLSAELHDALRPGVDAVRSAVLAMESAGLPHAGEPLRQGVAAGVVSEIRLAGEAPGARIRARKRGMPRAFPNAPKRLNARKWRHPVFSPDVWVDQRGAPGWFDDTLRRMRPQLRAAAAKALQARARRITRKV